jgi:hypothetical protein
MTWLQIVLIGIGVLVVLGGLLVAIGLMVGRSRLEAQEDALLPLGKVQGVIALSGLPPHQGVILNVCFYQVNAADSPPPYGGQPPPTAAVDLYKVYEDVHLDKESTATTREHPFSLEHPRGFFYVEVRAILFRKREDNQFAQAEQFFYGVRPLKISETVEASMTFPVSWPVDNLERLMTFGILRPQTPPPGEPPKM